MNIQKLQKIERVLQWFWSYHKPLQADDLSYDAHFVRAWFVWIALKEYSDITTKDVIKYLRYGTDESINNTLNWMKEHLEVAPHWNEYITMIKQKYEQLH